MEAALKNYYSETINEFHDENEINYADFKKLSKLYLPRDGEESQNGAMLKRGNLFFQLVQQKEYDELFLVLNKAPYFWIYDSHFNKFLKNFFRLNNTVKNESNSLLEFIKFYTRWVLGKTSEEKKFYAASAVDIIRKKKFAKHILSQIMEAVIYTFEPTLKLQPAAIELFDTSIEKIPSLKLPNDIENEMEYYLKLFKGFAFLKQNVLESAENMFTQALGIKTAGINAKFYLLLTSLLLKNTEVAESLFREIYDYDLERVQYALNLNDSRLFRAYCYENVMQNLFRHKECLAIFDSLSNEIGIRTGNSELLFGSLKSKLIDFKNINLRSKVSEDDLRQIYTIDDILSHFSKKNNIIFQSSLNLMENKFYDLLRTIIDLLGNAFESEIQSKLNMHDMQIEEGQATIDELQSEIESSKTNIRKKYDALIEKYKAAMNEKVSMLEDRIANLANQSEYNVFTVFKNNMFYNLFLSILVLLIIGFASYSNNEINDISNIQKLIKAFILTGAQWGIITFIMGSIFSLIHLLSVISERSNQKQILLKKIETIKKNYDNELNEIRKEREDTEKTIIEKIKEKIEFNEARIKNLLEERKKEEEELRQTYRTEIEKETCPLRALLPQ